MNHTMYICHGQEYIFCLLVTEHAKVIEHAYKVIGMKYFISLFDRN